MVDWSKLPTDLLTLIGYRLDSPFDRLHFRSICSSWRCSALPKPPSPSPLIPCECKRQYGGGHPLRGLCAINRLCIGGDGFRLCKRTIVSLRVLEPRQRRFPRDWIIKYNDEADAPQRLQVMDPLSGIIRKPPPSFSSKTLDLRDAQMSELGHEYAVEVRGCQLGPKCVVSWNADGTFVALAVKSCNRKIFVFRSSDNTSFSVGGDSDDYYDDVICFKGRFFAVERTGKAVIVETTGPSPQLIEIVSQYDDENMLTMGSKKWLVESQGDLLMVNSDLIRLSNEDSDSDSDLDSSEIPDFDRVIRKGLVTFEVYKLDLTTRKWVYIEIPYRILFLGDQCSFSAPASRFSLREGNAIYFSGNIFAGTDADTIFEGTNVSVYSLSKRFEISKQGKRYLKFFWPLPAWVSRLDKPSLLSSFSCVKRRRFELTEDGVCSGAS